jgi:ABC-2 type transport system permease protein
MRRLRSAFVIARRDFSATVLSKTFLFFLLGPLFPLLLGGAFGSIGARVASRTETPVVAVISSQADYARLAAARERVAAALGDPSVARLAYYVPEHDVAAQQRHLLASTSPPIGAVLIGGLAAPHLVGSVYPQGSTSGQIDLILAAARDPRAMAQVIPVTTVGASTGLLVRDRQLTGQIGQVGLFFLSLMLSTMLLSQLIEEKSNKIIEVIAAAVPIDSLFVGKLFAMLAASILGVIVWISAGALLIELVKSGGVETLPPPAVGWPGFLLLAVLYFGMNYLLLGAVFLTIGAQASTVREVQTMSMPVTFGQVLIFGLASTAIGAPNAPEALAAAIFPLSSPMVMLARGAEDSAWWPHLAALAWQALWVALILKVGARLFRKTVLKSGPRSRRWRRWRGRAETVGRIGTGS